MIDIYDRSAVVTLNGASMTADLALKTLRKALKRHHPGKGLILHSDQGSQFTSKEFTDFCEKNHVQQSMSRAGCPYDNAPMERFYNTLKHEYFNLRNFKDVEVLDQGVYQFIYGKYNRRHPHSYNGGLTPYLLNYYTFPGETDFCELIQITEKSIQDYSNSATCCSKMKSC
jgi:transposase InsO family protein